MSSATPAAPAAKPAGGSLGLVTCTALVIGNMVGSGFFIAPAALARFGTTALIGWAVMAVGAICLGMVFARLARIAPATGGPYAYTRLGFGRFAGFLIAWGYWISIWASLPAMAAALVGYLLSLFPALAGHRSVGIAIAIASMWGVALVNMRGVKAGGDLPVGDDLHQARTVRLDRRVRALLGRLAHLRDDQPQRRAVLLGSGSDGAPHHVRVPRHRVGDGARRRCDRSRGARFRAPRSSAPSCRR